jgi:hypothetical protein
MDEEKKPGGVALILGGGHPMGEESHDDEGELAFKAFKKALDSNDATKGFAAFQKLMEAADDDEPTKSDDHEEDEPEEDELDL